MTPASGGHRAQPIDELAGWCVRCATRSQPVDIPDVRQRHVPDHTDVRRPPATPPLPGSDRRPVLHAPEPPGQCTGPTSSGIPLPAAPTAAGPSGLPQVLTLRTSTRHQRRPENRAPADRHSLHRREQLPSNDGAPSSSSHPRRSPASASMGLKAQRSAGRQCGEREGRTRPAARRPSPTASAEPGTARARDATGVLIDEFREVAQGSQRRTTRHPHDG